MPGSSAGLYLNCLMKPGQLKQKGPARSNPETDTQPPHGVSWSFLRIDYAFSVPETQELTFNLPNLEPGRSPSGQINTG